MSYRQSLMSMIPLLLCLCVCVGLATVSGSAPRVELSITQKGLNYANNIIIKQVVQEIQGLKIPPVRNKDLTLKNSAVKDVRIKSSSLQTDSSSNELVLSLDLGLLWIVGDYYMPPSWFAWGGAKGSFNLKLKKILIVTRLSLDKDKTGRPSVMAAGCATRITDSSMNFHGGLRWLLKIGYKLLKTPLQRKIETVICDAVTDAIEEKAEDVPRSYPARHSLPRTRCSSIGFPLLSSPAIRPSGIDLYMQANVTSCFNYSTRPQRDVPYVMPAPQDHMVSILIGEDLLNILAELHYRAGNLDKPLAIDQKNSISTTLSGSPTFIVKSSGVRMIARAVAIATGYDAKGAKQSVTRNLLLNGTAVIFEERRRLTVRITRIRIKEDSSGRKGPSAVKDPIKDMLLRKKMRSYMAIHKTTLLRDLNVEFRRIVLLPLLKGMNLKNNKRTYEEKRFILWSDLEV